MDDHVIEVILASLVSSALITLLVIVDRPRRRRDDDDGERAPDGPNHRTGDDD